MTPHRVLPRMPWCVAMPVLCIALSCSNGTEPRPLGAAMSVQPSDIVLFPGDTLSLAVTVLDGSGAPIDGVGVSFRSDDSAVAIVSDVGLLHAVAPGTAHVTVQADTLTAVVEITVLGIPVAVEVAPASARLNVGQSVRLNARVLDVLGREVSGIAVGFRTGNASVAVVSGAGTVTAAGPGVTTVTASAGPLSATVPVTVLSVVASPADLVIARDSTVQLTVTVVDSAGAVVANPALAFHSADTTIATVSATGLVRGIGTGHTFVTASYSSLSASVSVVVADVILEGVVLQEVALSSRPYAVAVSSSDLVFVTQLDGASVGRAQLPTLAFSSPISVGSVPTDVAFNPAGTTAYVTNQFSSSVGVIDVAAGVQLAAVSTATWGTPYRVVVTPDGQTAYVSTNSGSVLAINAATRTVRTTYTLSGALNGLALHPTYPLLYATSMTDGRLYEVNTLTGAVRSVSVGGMPQDVVVSPDGATLFVADELGPLQIRVAATGALTDTVSSISGAFGLGFAPGGWQLLASRPSQASLMVLNIYSLAAHSVPTCGVPRRIAFGPDGTRAIVACEDGVVLVYR